MPGNRPDETDSPAGAPGALKEAWDIQTRAAKVGFDWPDITGVFEKVHEEIEEIRQALREGHAENARRELGDLLFAAVNLARFLEADPETVLCGTNERFQSRFAKVKEVVEAAGRRMEECTLAELDAVWDRIKAEE